MYGNYYDDGRAFGSEEEIPPSVLAGLAVGDPVAIAEFAQLLPRFRQSLSSSDSRRSTGVFASGASKGNKYTCCDKEQAKRAAISLGLLVWYGFAVPAQSYIWGTNLLNQAQGLPEYAQQLPALEPILNPALLWYASLFNNIAVTIYLVNVQKIYRVLANQYKAWWKDSKAWTGATVGLAAYLVYCGANLFLPVITDRPYTNPNSTILPEVSWLYGELDASEDWIRYLMAGFILVAGVMNAIPATTLAKQFVDVIRYTFATNDQRVEQQTLVKVREVYGELWAKPIATELLGAIKTLIRGSNDLEPEHESELIALVLDAITPQALLAAALRQRQLMRSYRPLLAVINAVSLYFLIVGLLPWDLEALKNSNAAIALPTIVVGACMVAGIGADIVKMFRHLLFQFASCGSKRKAFYPSNSMHVLLDLILAVAAAFVLFYAAFVVLSVADQSFLKTCCDMMNQTWDVNETRDNSTALCPEDPCFWFNLEKGQSFVSVYEFNTPSMVLMLALLNRLLRRVTACCSSASQTKENRQEIEDKLNKKIETQSLSKRELGSFLRELDRAELTGVVASSENKLLNLAVQNLLAYRSFDRYPKDGQSLLNLLFEYQPNSKLSSDAAKPLGLYPADESSSALRIGVGATKSALILAAAVASVVLYLAGSDKRPQAWDDLTRTEDVVFLALIIVAGMLDPLVKLFRNLNHYDSGPKLCCPGEDRDLVHRIGIKRRGRALMTLPAFVAAAALVAVNYLAASEFIQACFLPGIADYPKESQIVAIACLQIFLGVGLTGVFVGSTNMLVSMMIACCAERQKSRLEPSLAMPLTKLSRSSVMTTGNEQAAADNKDGAITYDAALDDNFSV